VSTPWDYTPPSPQPEDEATPGITPPGDGEEQLQALQVGSNGSDEDHEQAAETNGEAPPWPDIPPFNIAANVPRRPVIELCGGWMWAEREWVDRRQSTSRRQAEIWQTPRTLEQDPVAAYTVMRLTEDPFIIVASMHVLSPIGHVPNGETSNSGELSDTGATGSCTSRESA
jgi:hypothetical protein